ncbi:MAG TPA: hypothetical protein VEC60_05725 [Reyranella sp.]|nr:hypothetical protein [Reyranella sp.]
MLEAEIAELKDAIVVLERLGPGKGNPAAVYRRLVLPYAVLPIAILIGLHYVLLIQLRELPLSLIPTMRGLSIIVPALFGYLLETRWRPPWQLTATAAVVVAVMAVLAMNAAVHLMQPRSPIIPDSPEHWRDTVEYVASIALGYAFGVLLAISLKSRRGRGSLAEKLAMMMAPGGAGMQDPKAIDQRIDRLYKLINLSVSGTTVIGSVYTGFKSVL